jgi:cell division initiation protein
MVMTPDEIENHGFSRVWRGYDPAEVDDFLKEIAAAQAQAQPPPASTPAAPTGSGHDDFERLGDAVAAVLRQTHESVATLRRRAEAEAAVIHRTAECEADGLRQEAERDRQAAAVALEAAHAESARVMTDIQRQVDSATEQAATAARQRTREIIEAARLEARGAVLAQRNARDRLEGTRDDIEQALDRLVEEDEELFATIDLTDTAPGEGPGLELVPPLEQGSPPPPVSLPIRTTPTSIEDLPYHDGLVGEPPDPTDGDGDDWLTAIEETHPT